MNKKVIEVLEINSKDCLDFILNKHYAQRKPSISFAFGLYIKGGLCGILTIGKPASNSLCEGVCGKEYKQYVYELNRLCVVEGLEKNTLSFFVGKVLKLLRDKKIILISYADEGMNHHGYIYQATNWIYTGKTAKRTDKYTPNNKHSRHYTDEFNHLRKFRSSKFRYLYIPNKKFKKIVLKELKYPILNYPKGENKRYVLGEKMKVKVFNKLTNTFYYE